jgi:hypothetical protein
MTTDDGNSDKKPEKIGESASDDLKVKTIIKQDIASKRSFRMPADIGSLFAEDVKVMCDDSSRICTLLFFKKHVMPRLTGRELEVDSIQHEGVMEIKLPYSSAFLLARYMNEIYKEIQAGKSRITRFGPRGLI